MVIQASSWALFIESFVALWFRDSIDRMCFFDLFLFLRGVAVLFVSRSAGTTSIESGDVVQVSVNN